MFKRLLIFVIAGCLVLDSSATVYATSLPVGTVIADGTEETPEAAEESTENDLEQEKAGEVDLEESKEGLEFAVDTSEAEESSVEEVAGEETKESNQEETIVEKVTSSEETTENITDMKMDESILEEQTKENGEELLLEKESEIYIDTVSEEVISLKFGETNTITLPADYDECMNQWYSFSAPEDGYYNLNTGDGYISLHTSVGGGTVNSSFHGNLYIGFMEAGETVYFRGYNGTAEDVTIDLTLQKPIVLNTTRQEDASYFFDTENYVLSILPEMGYNTIRIRASIEAKEGKNIESSYRLVAVYRRIDSATGYSGSSLIELCSDQNYQSEHKVTLSNDSVYRLYFVLLDAFDHVLEVYDGNIILQAKKTDEEIVIYDTAVTENSITFDMEAIIGRSYCCYYAPIDGSEEEKFIYVYRGWEKCSITDLKPDTEYYFRFVNSSSAKTVFETRAVTASTTVKAAYSVYVDEDSGQPVLKADISGYAGDETEGWFWYEYTDALGIKQATGEMISFSATESENDLEKTGVIEKTFTFEADVLEAEKSYDITTWVEIGELILPKEVRTITTPKALVDEQNLKFIIEQDGTAAKYTVEADSIKNVISGALYYRQQGMKGSYSSQRLRLSNTNTQTIGTISDLQNGAAYDFILLVGGVKKELTATFGTAGIKLTQIGEGEINAFDIVRTYKVESETEFDENYSLTLFYWNNLLDGYEEILQTSLNVENEYHAEIKTALSGFMFDMDTDYELKWELKSNSEEIYTYCETIHTKKANITWEAIEGNYCLQKYKVALDSKDIANFENFSLNLGVYIKKTESADNYQVRTDTAFFSNSAGCSYTIWLSGLEPNTSYEVFLRSYNDIEYGTNTFTTLSDTRQLSVTGIEAGLHEAIINYLLTGFDSSMAGYVLCYIREKGTENAWERADVQYYNKVDGNQMKQMHISSYKGVELKDNAIYEYQIGLGGYDNTVVSKLKKTIMGEFSTAGDTRTLSNVEVSASYTTANVSAVLSGNDYCIDSYLHFFYREKDTLSWMKISAITDDSSYNYSERIIGLKSGATYEYVMVISDDYACNNPDEVTKDSRKAVGEFITKKSNYTLEFEADDSKTTNNKAVVLVSAKNSTADARVKVELTLSDGQEQTITLKQSEDYKKEVSFLNLTGNTEYTITRAVLSVSENGSYTVVGEISCDYKFTTKKSEIPVSLTLSEEKINLNAVYAGEYYEGYSGKTLKATASPAASAADFIWTSSNEAVASVENGQVYAHGTGTATIAVASAYDPNVKAACEVTVRDYVIGYMEDGILQTFDQYYSRCTIYKNSYVEGFGFYERNSDGNLTLLSDYTVTSVRSEIASWNNGRLYGLAPGTTVMNFEKEGFKARITVAVEAEGKGFGINDFESSMDRYPAVKEADGQFTLAYTEGISYMAVGEISPKQYFYPEDFKWSISDTAIAEVSSMGVITPKKAGTVKLTVTPLIHYTINNKPYINEEVIITLNIKNLPTQEAYEPIYALANVDTKIGDVDFPESWGKGWTWKYPNTPIVTNGVYSNNQYSFEAVYDGAESYPDETTVSVYIGKITGAAADEILPDGTKAAHNQVLETGGTDAVLLQVSPVYEGSITPASYDVEIPVVDGLTITKNVDGNFEIKAQKKGSYTLKPVIKAKNTEKVLAKATYKIKAVEEKQVGSITFSTDTEGVVLSGNAVIFETAEAKKDFTLNAVVKDRYGAEITTALTWKTTDKTVAAVAPASKNDTHYAKVTVKGEGHTVITAAAKDTAGIWAEVDVEIQDHTPRVDTEKVAINLAYDYEEYYGQEFASVAGAVEIAPVYGESLAEVELRNQNGEKAAENLKLEPYSGYRYLVQPYSDNLKVGNYDCKIYVKTNVGREYTYPLKVTVTDKSPKVSVKTKTKANLFFTNTTGRIDVSISGGTKSNYGNIESVTWEDTSKEVNNGFAMNGYYDSTKKTDYLSVSQQSGLKVVKGNLSDAGVVSGDLTIKLRGYKKLYKFDNFAIGYEYKKPVIETRDASSNIMPSVGLRKAGFNVYDKTNKRYLYFGERYSTQYFDEILCDSDEVTLLPSENSQSVTYFYNGKESSKKITLTLDSLVWRETLTMTHTIKEIKPTAFLSASGQLTFNTALKDTGYIYIHLKNAWYSITYDDVIIQGANAKAQKLLDDDLLVITTSGNGIQVSQSRTELMGVSIPAGTYSYKVTPYYMNQETDEKTALNTMTLKVKVVNKPVVAKVSPKGSLDLTYGTGYNVSEKKNTVVLVDPKFSNLSSGYGLNTSDSSAYRLIGEYSEYFELSYGWIRYNNKYGYHYYISIKDNANSNSTRKLKAGQSYKLAIEYTLTNNDGESLKVTSNTFTIKPKQTAAKVTVTNNNQTLYAGADNLSRSYFLSVPAYYSIESAYGSLDCNKDGRADITVSGAGSLTVRITDKDAVGATAKGKSYSIPVTVRLRGRDGISKDVKITIKVKVKR